MGLLSFFKSANHPSSPDAFEKELAELELKIERHQERLQAIKEREQRTNYVVTTYSLLLWCCYTFLWYMGWGWSCWKKSWNDYRLGKIGPHTLTRLDQVIEIMPIVLVPIVLIFVRRFCQTWYNSKHDSERIQLRQLQKQLREKVEELKKKTSYYITRDILERYDDKTKPFNNPSIRRVANPSPSMSTPDSLRQRIPPSSASSASPAAPNPQLTPSSPLAPMNAPLINPAQHRNRNAGQPLLSPANSVGRGWADRFAEALLGDDEAKPGSKYALICMNCSNHNGLVRQEELDTIQYVCPRCGVLNPAKTRRSRSPPHSELLPKKSLHANVRVTEKSSDPFAGNFEHTTSLSDMDQDARESEGGRRSTNRGLKQNQTRKSLGVPLSSLSGRLVQQKRSTSSTVHDKPMRGVSDDLPSLPTRDCSFDPLLARAAAEPLPEEEE